MEQGINTTDIAARLAAQDALLRTIIAVMASGKPDALDAIRRSVDGNVKIQQFEPQWLVNTPQAQEAIRKLSHDYLDRFWSGATRGAGQHSG